MVNVGSANETIVKSEPTLMLFGASDNCLLDIKIIITRF
jgi:hypothetical protein